MSVNEEKEGNAGEIGEIGREEEGRKCDGTRMLR